MKKIIEMGTALSKNEQKKIQGSKRTKACTAGTDNICCGTAHWQCGVGLGAGGYYNSANGTCACV
ncbi:hypothetical protein N9F08_00560 [bacterium]|nr:hypothetical protein [bacterium]